MKKYFPLLLLAVFVFPASVFAAFSDVPASHPNYDAVTFVQKRGVVEGYSDGTFRPNQLITRAEFTKIIVSTFHGEMDGSEANDCPALSDMKPEWYFPFVCFGLKNSIISGYRDKTFRPNTTVNFVEAAKMISNTAGLHALSDDSTIWYEHFVRELEHVGDIPTSILTFDQKITRGEMAEMVYRVKAGILTKPSMTYEQLAGVTVMPTSTPRACTEEVKSCPNGSAVGRNYNDACNFYPCPAWTASPMPVAGQIIKHVGEQEGSYLVQNIHADSVDGFWFEKYPIATNQGTPRTIYIGDDIGYACEGVSEKLTAIDFAGQTVTFTKITSESPHVGCPKCLSVGTLIDTPNGSFPVQDLTVGMSVWTVNAKGNRVVGTIVQTSKIPVPATHQMVHLIMDDGRELRVSPLHPLSDGRTAGDLHVGDSYDGTLVLVAGRVSYDGGATYDVLPSGDTGFYWANGVLIGSTLHSYSF